MTHDLGMMAVLALVIAWSIYRFWLWPVLRVICILAAAGLFMLHAIDLARHLS